MDERLGRRKPSIDGQKSFRLDNATGLLVDLAPEGVEQPFSSLNLPTGKFPAAMRDADEEDLPRDRW